MNRQDGGLRLPQPAILATKTADRDPPYGPRFQIASDRPTNAANQVVRSLPHGLDLGGREHILDEQSRSRKSRQDDKWNFCLITAIVAVNRRDHEQTTPPEPLTGLQGEGGSGRRQGRPNHRTAGGAFRRSPQSDHGME